MSLRKSANGRPSGTDGSDFSYRMVVDSRYKKVAQGKSRLSTVIFTQAFIQFLSAVVLFLSTPKWEMLDRLSVSSSIAGFLSLLFGELGRKRSRASLLKLYLFGSSVSALASIAFLFQSENSFQIIKDLSRVGKWNLELFRIAVVSLGIVAEVFAIIVTASLISNMAPPKRTS